MAIWFGLWILVAVIITGTRASEDERRLLTDLFKNYSIMERPTANFSVPVKVKFGVTIVRIMDMDVESGMLETNLWLRYIWNDSNLQWDAANYGGVDLIHVRMDRIWRPDIHAYNSEPIGYDMNNEHIMALVYPSGQVLYVPPVLFRTTCDMDFSRYPFDQHKCNVKFGSWTFEGGKLELGFYNDDPKADMSDYVKNIEWDLLEAPASLNIKFYPCCTESYHDITYSLHIKRKGESIYFGAKMANIFICFLLVMSLLLSPTSGQKFLAGLVGVAANLWIIVSANSVLPFNHNCYMAQYFDKLAILGSIVLLANLLVIHIHFRTHPMPRLMKKVIIDCLSSKFCIICPTRNKRHVTTELDTLQSNSYTEHRVEDDLLSGDSNADTQNLIAEIKQLKRQIQTVTVQNIDADSANDWKYLAVIVNRSFLIFFSIVLIIFVSISFPSLE